MADANFLVWIEGGDGGRGGDGRSGGNGGRGGDGGDGAAGGGGGGAVAVEALGRLIFETGDDIRVAVGGGAPGDIGDAAPGLEGGRADPVPSFGERGGRQNDTFVNTVTNETAKVGAGGRGGDGGRGAGGASGGDGGDGGAGAPGAAGSAKFSASVIDAGGPVTVDADPGAGDSGPDGFGRAIVASNSGGVDIHGNARVEQFEGPSDVQPYVKGTRVETEGFPPIRFTIPFFTPLIPDLVGGAETFGLLSGVDARDPFFAPYLSGFDASSLAALVRLDRGPGPLYDYSLTGVDWLFFLNLGPDPLTAPLLGADPKETDFDFLEPLRLGGWTRDAAYGGSGDELLAELAGYAVFAMLVPDDGTLFNFAGSGLTASAVLKNGDSLSLGGGVTAPIPLPPGAWLLLSGVGALAALRRKRASADLHPTPPTETRERASV